VRLAFGSRGLAARAVLVLMSAFLFSCGSDDKDNSKLTLSFRNKSPFLIPSSTVSCVGFLVGRNTTEGPAADIQSRYFSLSKPEISWKDTERSLVVTMIRVKMNSTALGIDYECGIFEDELSAVFGDGASSPWDRTLPKATKSGEEVVPRVRKAMSLCPSIKCGGIEPANDVRTSASATLEVIGFSINDDGDEFPVRYTTTLSIENDP
jgi:hypothetical protein